MIKLHQYNLRSRKVFAKLVELSYIVEVRSIAPGCGLDDPLLTHLVQMGCRSLVLMNIPNNNLLVSDLDVVVEDVDAI
jgi:hypothetical protein